MKKISLNLAYATLGLAVTALVGCASKDTQPEPTGSVEPPIAYQPDVRSYHSSWGHSGRGGAAVRKPAYQHVLATPDRLDVPVGRLYPAARSADSDASRPAGDAQLSQLMTSGSSVPSMDGKPSCNADFRVIASAREMTDDYIQVRNKLCAGADRLTFEEWEILVNGTPKDVPASLQVFPAPNLPPLSGGSNE